MTTDRTTLVLLTAVMLLAFSFAPNSVTDYLKVPGPIVFEKASYNLSWSAHPSPGFYKQEYIVKGDVVDKYKTMILIDAITGDVNIRNIVATKVAELKQLKQGNPIVNYETFDNSARGEYMIDFLLSANTADGKISIIERDVYRYKTFTDPSGKKGVLLFGVSTRGYGNEVDKFLTSLKTNKKDLVDAVAGFKIPEITIAK